LVELPVVLADRIFGQECRTAEVYEARTKHIVDSVVRGFNGNLDCSVRWGCCFQGTNKLGPNAFQSCIL